MDLIINNMDFPQLESLWKATFPDYSIDDYIDTLNYETEVEIMETVDMGETDFRSLIEGDRKYGREDNLGEHGYTEQEFQDEQLVDVEEEPDEEDFEIEFEETDDFAYNDSDNE